MATKTRHTNGGLRKVCGCARRTWAKCPHGWYLNFKPRGGKSYRLSLDKCLGKHIDNKTDAETEAEKIRIAIKEGRFGQSAPPISEITIQQLGDTFLKGYVVGKHGTPIAPRTKVEHRYGLGTICKTVVERPTGGRAPFGQWRVADVTTDTIEQFRNVRLAEGKGQIGVNRNVRLLRELFNWAIRAKYVKESPFKIGTETAVTLGKEERRSRRLKDGEEEKLLASAGVHLHAVIVAALETGMRRGEITSLVWSQIEGMRLKENGTVKWAVNSEIFLPAWKTKTKKDRRVPINARLRSVLEMRRFDAASKPMADDQFVFGTEIGSRVADFSRAWETAVLKANGHKPVFVKTNLSTQSRTVLAAIDLNFHDLRREAGSRWMDAGVPLATIQRWLGHSNIAQTSTYLSGNTSQEHDAMRAYEERRAALQRIATGSETGGRKSPQSAGTPDRKANKTAGVREPTIM